MSSTVEKRGPSRADLTVEIPFADLAPHLDKAYADIAASVTIPGFGEGKVPPLVIDQRFGRGAVMQEAINAALPSAYEAAANEAKVIPLAGPEVEATKSVDAEVDKHIEMLRSRFATTSEVDGAAARVIGQLGTWWPAVTASRCRTAPPPTSPT